VLTLLVIGSDYFKFVGFVEIVNNRSNETTSSILASDNNTLDLILRGWWW
jgi:hypothetical protein